MLLSMHSASVPVFVRMLTRFGKAEAHAKARNFDPNHVLAMRLEPDMLPFPRETLLKHLSLPNFSFHVTLTYALLRQGGVDLGKMDYLGAP